MGLVKLSAEEIAEKQLIAAFHLWKEDDYISAITLAGAAEEILGQRLRKMGREPSFDNLLKALLKIAKISGNDNANNKKVFADLLNSTRNELKHYSGDEILEFDLREDSVEMMERAITNYLLLTDNVLDEMIEFWGEIDGT